MASIKCVVWDLDDTLWRGTLLEGDELAVSDTVRDTIRELDRRGILQSVASKNDHSEAWAKLTAFGLEDYFLHPQINWSDKSHSLRAIAECLGIGLDAVALIDDQRVEQEEVRFYLPEVTTLDPAELGDLLDLPALRPRFVTSDARHRREMHKADLRRRTDEEESGGHREEFLATLGMIVTIRRATLEDLHRAEELTVRTNQLNTTGRPYSYEELESCLNSPDHLVLVTELDDRYGSSGTIGLALIERSRAAWRINLFILSCRVLTRGVGGIVLSYVLQAAKDHGVTLSAAFKPNDRNRMMYITYKFNGFSEVGEEDGIVLLEHPLETIRAFPPHVTVRVPLAETRSSV